MKTEVLFMLSMVTIFLVGSHFHDVGNVLNDYNEKIASNGYINIDAVKLSHIGWYMMYLAFFILIIAYIDLMLELKKRYKND